MLHALLLVAAVLVPAPVPSDVPLEHVWTVGLDAWKVGDGIRSVHVVDDLLLVEDSANAVTALERDTGAARWVVRMDGPLAETPGFASGRVTLATNRHVTVIDAGSGRHLYDQQLSIETAAAPVAGEFLVFEPSLHESTLYARRLSNGLIAWRYRIKSDFRGQALYMPGATESLLVVPCTDGMLRAIPATLDMPEALRWTLDVGTPVGLLAHEGSTLVFASQRRAAFAIDTASGGVRWKAGLGARPLSGPILVDDVAVVGTEDGLIAIKLDSGLRAWTTDTEEVPLAGVPGLIISRRASGRILGRKTSDGSLLEIPVGPRVLGTGDYLVDWSDRHSVSAARSTVRHTSSVH